ncbi:MAG: type B DNA-directed DNA polymerase [Methanomicrobiales archaeon]|nr:type B DNA-directed DNA polymerase [Methanomicrobiales archaeon]
MPMWILDTAYRDGVDLWCRDGNGRVVQQHYDYDPPFYLHLPDPAAHHDMLDVLEEEFRAGPCRFLTLFGERDGFSVHGSRHLAERIEEQTRFEARLFNVDVRRDQQFMAETGIFPCCDDPALRYSPDMTADLRQLEIHTREDPARTPLCTDVELVSDRTEHLQGRGSTVAEDLFGMVEAIDPEVILMSNADSWLPKLHAYARDRGLDMPFSRNGRYRQMFSRSYWSYGRVEHKGAALIPEGRVLIDTEESFVYREGGLAGVLMASRLAGLSPNLAARFTPGTLISSYEVYEAVKRKITVPFRKADAETARKLADLQAADRGGMMFQPSPGIYEHVDELDFTSMYPSIIVKFNLSPETLENPDRAGFLPAVLAPVVALRRDTKKRKKTNPRYAGIDTLLKWMLVTCFGYTGYRNAKFGRIEVHEAITNRSREILIQAKDLAESMGHTVLHGIVDCLWVQGPDVAALQQGIGDITGLWAENEHFDWIVFLPLNDGFGAYNRYYGRLSDGSVKVRGIAARRHDTPDLIRTMQQEMLGVLGTARTIDELERTQGTVQEIYQRFRHDLLHADPATLAISRRISRTRYVHRCLEGAAVQAYRDAGVEVAPGMKIAYVVRDAGRYQVDPVWDAGTVDAAYYRGLMEKAWKEIAYAVAGTRGTRIPGGVAERNAGIPGP